METAKEVLDAIQAAQAVLVRVQELPVVLRQKGGLNLPAVNAIVADVPSAQAGLAQLAAEFQGMIDLTELRDAAMSADETSIGEVPVPTIRDLRGTEVHDETPVGDGEDSGAHETQPPHDIFENE